MGLVAFLVEGFFVKVRAGSNKVVHNIFGSSSSESTRNDDLKVKKILGWSCSHPFPILLMATRKPVVAPVEVGSLSNYFQDFIYPRLLAGFLHGWNNPFTNQAPAGHPIRFR